jgi:hypothetical protein
MKMDSLLLGSQGSKQFFVYGLLLNGQFHQNADCPSNCVVPLGVWFGLGPPPPPRLVAPPPFGSGGGGGGTLACGRGDGGSQFGRGDRYSGTLGIILHLYAVHSKNAAAQTKVFRP